LQNAKVLLVDDDETVRFTLSTVLRRSQFDVTVASNVSDALKMISSQYFDVLVSDLHMPGAGDGLTVVGAMRHANPQAVTFLLTAFPAMQAAADAIMLHADEILVKPMHVEDLVAVIKQRLSTGAPLARVTESVAAILERSSSSIIQDWYEHIETEELLMNVPMTREMRCSHLPQLFKDLIYRLRLQRELGTKELLSFSASEHGLNRRKQSYSAAMLVEESRQLQVSIFRGLQKNLASIDFNVVLIGVMTIADEIDSQLSQAMKSYIAESNIDALPSAA
jgi:DNA-binding response OmpR family regulator